MSCKGQQLLSEVLIITLSQSGRGSLHLPLSLVCGHRPPAVANFRCCRILWCFYNPVIQPECVICFLLGSWLREKKQTNKNKQTKTTYPGHFFLILLRMPLGFHHNDNFGNWCKIGVLHYVQKVSLSLWFPEFYQLHFIFCILIYIEFALKLDYWCILLYSEVFLYQ